VRHASETTTKAELTYSTMHGAWTVTLVDADGTRREQVEELLGYDAIRAGLAALTDESDADEARDALETALVGTTLEGVEVEVCS